MRDKNRIPKILAELERIWMANPDYRLGQLIMVAAKPTESCPSVFHIEDDKLLNGLLAFEKRDRELLNEEPDWKKYPDISKIKPEAITIDLIVEMINAIKKQEKDIVITPINLMRLNGAPVADNGWMLKQKSRVKKLKRILAQLGEMGVLEERESKQDFLGIKEVGYNIRNSKS